MLVHKKSLKTRVVRAVARGSRIASRPVRTAPARSTISAATSRMTLKCARLSAQCVALKAALSVAREKLRDQKKDFTARLQEARAAVTRPVRRVTRVRALAPVKRTGRTVASKLVATTARVRRPVAARRVTRVKSVLATAVPPKRTTTRARVSVARAL